MPGCCSRFATAPSKKANTPADPTEWRRPRITLAVLAGCFPKEHAVKIERLDGNRVRRYTNCEGVTVIVLANRLALIPAEQEAKRDTWQAQSDLWSWRVAFETKECNQ